MQLIKKTIESNDVVIDEARVLAKFLSLISKNAQQMNGYL